MYCSKSFIKDKNTRLAFQDPLSLKNYNWYRAFKAYTMLKLFSAISLGNCFFQCNDLFYCHVLSLLPATDKMKLRAEKHPNNYLYQAAARRLGDSSLKTIFPLRFPLQDCKQSRDQLPRIICVNPSRESICHLCPNQNHER